MNARRSEHEYPTRLNDSQYDSCWKTAETFLKKHGCIRNKQLREITGISYDQAIDFFKRATGEKRLVREGSGSATHYVLTRK